VRVSKRTTTTTTRRRRRTTTTTISKKAVVTILYRKGRKERARWAGICLAKMKMTMALQQFDPPRVPQLYPPMAMMMVTLLLQMLRSR
jgi:hypothetical protein